MTDCRSGTEDVQNFPGTSCHARKQRSYRVQGIYQKISETNLNWLLQVKEGTFLISIRVMFAVELNM